MTQKRRNLSREWLSFQLTSVSTTNGRLLCSMKFIVWPLFREDDYAGPFHCVSQSVVQSEKYNWCIVCMPHTIALPFLFNLCVFPSFSLSLGLLDQARLHFPKECRNPRIEQRAVVITLPANAPPKNSTGLHASWQWEHATFCWVKVKKDLKQQRQLLRQSPLTTLMVRNTNKIAVSF